MSNTLITPQIIAKMAVASVSSTLVVGNKISYDIAKELIASGSKIGQTIDAKREILVNIVRDNMAFSAQSAIQTRIPISISSTLTTNLNFTDFQLAMRLESFAKEVAPGVFNKFASDIDLDLQEAMVNARPGGSAIVDNYGNPLAGGNYRGVAGWVVGKVGETLTRRTLSNAINRLRISGCEIDGDVYGVLTPDANADLIEQNASLFNANAAISKIYTSGYLGDMYGVHFNTSNVNASHTNGTVNALTVATGGNSADVWTETATFTFTALGANKTINAGDVFEATGRYKVHPLTGANTGVPMQFTAIETVTTGATSVKVFPAPVTSGPYKNITGAVTGLTLVGDINEVGAESLIFHKKAIAGAFKDLTPLNNSSKIVRETDLTNLTMRYTEFGDIYGMANATVAVSGVTGTPGAGVGTIQFGEPTHIRRMDTAYGFRILRGEWICRIRSKAQ